MTIENKWKFKRNSDTEYTDGMKKQIAQYSIKMGESNERKKEKMREKKKLTCGVNLLIRRLRFEWKKGSFKNHHLKYKIVKSMGRESMGLLYKRFTENYSIYHNVENKLQW